MPSIFPQSSTENVNNIIIAKASPSYGKSPVFLFDRGEFRKVDGRVYIGEGKEVLENWIEKTLRTERYRFPIYSPDYGVTLEDIRVENPAYRVMVNEIRDNIRDALLQDPRITGVGKFKFSREGSCLSIRFEVETFDDEILTMEVSV